MAARRIDDLTALEERVRGGLRRLQRDANTLATDVARVVDAWRPESLAQHLTYSAASRVRAALRTSPVRAREFLTEAAAWLGRDTGERTSNSGESD